MDLQGDSDENVPDEHHREGAPKSGCILVAKIIVVDGLVHLLTKADHAGEHAETELTVVVIVDEYHIIPRKGTERTDDGDEREAPDIFPGHG